MRLWTFAWRTALRLLSITLLFGIPLFLLQWIAFQFVDEDELVEKTYGVFPDEVLVVAECIHDKCFGRPVDSDADLPERFQGKDILSEDALRQQHVVLLRGEELEFLRAGKWCRSPMETTSQGWIGGYSDEGQIVFALSFDRGTPLSLRFGNYRIPAPNRRKLDACSMGTSLSLIWFGNRLANSRGR